MEEHKPSQTARGVALVSLCLSVDRAHSGLVPPEYADRLARLMVATGEMSNLAVWFYQTRIGLWLVRRVFDKSMPGQFAEFGNRKAYFEAQARNAIAAGAHQILVLGAGYDLLCSRLAPEFPGVCFFEIDHPATALAKRRGLDILGMPENLRQISVDLAKTPLREALSNQDSWDKSARSFVIAEGLTQYLTEDVVKDLFETVDSQTGPSSRFGFTFVGWREQEDRPEAGPFTDNVLADFEKRGEPWLWGISIGKLSGFLEGTPWELIEEVKPAGMESFACVKKL
jgi:methyltransferase (TIGR00027 family)